MRDAAEVEATEQPSKKGGRMAATSSISAAAIARLLTGIHFPKNKSNLRNYAKKNIPKVNSTDPNKILDILNSLPDIEYRDMADVEKSIGNLI
jgi:hypothetical protein